MREQAYIALGTSKPNEKTLFYVNMRFLALGEGQAWQTGNVLHFMGIVLYS